MTIDEAIESLKHLADNLEHNYSDDYRPEIQLGIEALRRIKGNRNVFPDTLLPGETEKEEG